MGQVVIRDARVSDAAGVARVRVETWQHTYTGLLPEDFLNNLSIEKSTENWRQRISQISSNSKTIVAELGGSVVGYIGIGPSRDSDDPEMAEVYTIYVDPLHQGKGIGSSLIKTGIEFLRNLGFKKVTLWVFGDNHKAIKYYESLWWTPTGKTQIDKLDDLELHEIQYGTAI